MAGRISGPKDFIVLPQVLELIRSLSFGALSVNAVLLLVHSHYPQFFPETFTYKEILAIGTLVGTVTHRALNAAAFNPFTQAIAKAVGFYTKLYELGVLRVRGIINEQEYWRISAKMKNEYFGVSLNERINPIGSDHALETKMNDLRMTDSQAVEAEASHPKTSIST